MKKILLCWALIGWAGCDFKTPLVTTPDLDTDPALMGLWRITEPEGDSANLLVLPLNKREYLVSYPAGTEHALFARGCHWRSGEARLVQLDWFGTAKGAGVNTSESFQFARYTITDDTLRVEMVQATAIPGEITRTEDLARSILDQWKTPELFGEVAVFTRIRAKPAPEANGAPANGDATRGSDEPASELSPNPPQED
jgi:hypothetical protein